MNDSPQLGNGVLSLPDDLILASLDGTTPTAAAETRAALQALTHATRAYCTVRQRTAAQIVQSLWPSAEVLIFDAGSDGETITPLLVLDTAGAALWVSRDMHPPAHHAAEAYEREHGLAPQLEVLTYAALTACLSSACRVDPGFFTSYQGSIDGWYRLLTVTISIALPMPDLVPAPHRMLIWAHGDDPYPTYIKATGSAACVVVYFAREPGIDASYETDPVIGLTVGDAGDWILYRRDAEDGPPVTLAQGVLALDPQTTEFVQTDGGDNVCPCGNTAADGGFTTCDTNGRISVDSAANTWRCDRCGRVFVLPSGQVLGVAR